MLTSVLRTVLCVVMLASCFAGPVVAAESAPGKEADGGAMRTWTSVRGATIEAELVEVKGYRVVLRKADGSLVRVAVSGLIPADRALARELANRTPGAARFEREGSKPHLLPLFLDGEWEGQHAVYRHRNFDAFVQPNGLLSIQLLDKGKKVSKPLTLRPDYQFRTDGGSLKGDSVAEFTRYATPTANAETLTFGGTLSTGVRFEYTYAFEDNTIRFWAGFEPPKDSEQRAWLRIWCMSPELFTFDENATIADIQKAAKDHKVRINPPKGKTLTFPYGVAIDRFDTHADEVSFDGPTYGPRRIEVAASRPKKSPLRPQLYEGTAPWQGFFIGLREEDQTSIDEKHCMVVTID